MTVGIRLVDVQEGVAVWIGRLLLCDKGVDNNTPESGADKGAVDLVAPVVLPGDVGAP